MSVLQHVWNRSSGSAFFISTSTARSFSASTTGLVLGLLASMAAFFSASAAALAASFLLSSSSSSGVGSGGSPSLIRRARLSSSSFCLIFSRAAASSFFSLSFSMRNLLRAWSSSMRFASAIALPALTRFFSLSMSAFLSSASRRALAARTISSALRLASSGVSFFFSALLLGTSSGSSTSMSSAWSMHQFTAFSMVSQPVLYSARTALFLLNPMSASSFSMSSGRMGSTCSSSSPEVEAPPRPSSAFIAFISSFISVLRVFISPSVSIAWAVSVVLSTNSAWPVLLVWMSFSVSLRHGLPHSLHFRVSTASVDSAKSAWPVASPWDCASATLRSCIPQTLHLRESACDIG
mmetsp:Transcript_43209/g.137983  ORF Transcript_43209/g.137983 Transcript_43209/m.137983 type:complete len:351 (+) Transcript_43209:331-1383(+)